MIKKTSVILILCVFAYAATAQKTIRNFIFGHSLIHHEFQLNPTPSQETSLPHWFAALADAAGHSYAISGQYGFLPQHANLPPMAQWGFENAEGAWDSENEDFSDADFNSILLTPGNFIQWQSPTENYPSDNISPTEATVQIFNWCNNNETSLKFYIYENWPDMAPYLSNGFPPSTEEWNNYNQYLNGDFKTWFIDYYKIVSQSFPNSCISYIPVGTIISKLLELSPFDQITPQELYEDDAPHGKPTIYFLASLITYMAMYEEEAPIDYQVDPIVHELVVENYAIVKNFIWSELNLIENNSDGVKVFCQAPITSSISANRADTQISLLPNPVHEQLTVTTELGKHSIEIYNMLGQKMVSSSMAKSGVVEINVTSLQIGNHLILGKDENGKLLYKKQFIKI